MRSKVLYIIVALLFVGYILLEVIPQKPHDWSVSYGTRESKPFGTKLLYERLPDLFPGQDIKVSQSEPSKSLVEFEKQKSNYIIITGDLEMSTKDAQALLNFARRGNTLFVAAETFSGPFADSLNIENKTSLMRRTDDLFEPAPKGNALLFSDGEGPSLDKVYPLMDFIHYNFFDYAEGEELSVNKDGSTVYQRIPIGDGEVLVHTVPFAFTNYYMVDPICHQYISHALSYLPVQNVIWDDHFKPGNMNMQSTVSYVLDSPALRFAWIMLLVTLVIFIVFDGKRRQRIIPPLEPNTNTTLEFVQTVSRLYLGHADHKDIAEKKIKYFLEYIRLRWMIATQDLNEQFESKLAAKSGVPLHDVKDLIHVIRGIQAVKKIEGPTLILLSNKIESFYTNSH